MGVVALSVTSSHPDISTAAPSFIAAPATIEGMTDSSGRDSLELGRDFAHGGSLRCKVETCVIGRGPGVQHLGMFLQIFSDFSASCVCLSLAFIMYTAYQTSYISVEYFVITYPARRHPIAGVGHYS